MDIVYKGKSGRKRAGSYIAFIAKNGVRVGEREVCAGGSEKFFDVDTRDREVLVPDSETIVEILIVYQEFLTNWFAGNQPPF